MLGRRRNPEMEPEVTIIGAGLAGSEAAWQLARRGRKVHLYEMRPGKKTPAHKTGFFAELVCSNSLRSNHLANAVGLLKEEMRRLDSLIIQVADRKQVPAGGALAVDREGFAYEITRTLAEHPNVEVIRSEVQSIPAARPLIIATGPLTSEGLTVSIQRMTGEDYLYFFDAAAPIVTADSIDYDRAFKASRYDRGEAAYINCPLNEEKYMAFYQALLNAEEHPLEDFEDETYFEGCLPVEEMARRGEQTLLYGPLKPVGLIDPRTGQQPYAVVQLRQDNREGTLFNLVGFQTRLKWGEQKRVFQMIPGMEEAEFVRYGVMHRNTFINSPRLLDAAYKYRKEQGLFFAGQITGVEGYVESASSGLVSGINAARLLQGKEPVIFPAETAIGALARYISAKDGGDFQPMNVNFGIIPPLAERIRNKRERKMAYSERALEVLEGLNLG
ncbi:MAG: methylenetetrahydrofolate--tRNA-(uracil(54)-C(5))-methyltransferase (FADH(2)-oxidizing) TrmFO [Halanaerobium sp.]|nr:methylenetetrahydrofolate--tRNA-(uracil(54)-C(5))-methyltransferase (FADH(2)-oxidizing) TrmFO [Halanaerobium sp.]